MMSHRLLAGAFIAGVALFAIAPSSFADGWGGTAPSFRFPPASPNWGAPAQNPTQRLREPQAMLPPPDPSSRALGGVSVPQQLQRPNPLLNLNATDVLNQPDQYTSSPQVDSSGVRHFSNGRHFDLSSTSIQDAVAQTNSSTLGRSNKQQLDVQQQQARDARRQARMQAAMMRRSGGFGMQQQQPYVQSYQNGQQQAPYSQGFQNGSQQPFNSNGFQPRDGSQYDMDRYQRRAMRRRAREMQIQNFNF